jgi:predicted Rossmann fold nucleotide-binding protein DprA/Smf involved in DNA uptake
VSERVAIVGTREPDEETAEAVRALVRSLPAGSVVISGDADGVDTIARETAIECGLGMTALAPIAGGIVEIRGYSMMSNRMGEVAPVRRRVLVRADADFREVALMRNTWIVVLADRVVAFVRGSRGGTWDAVRQAERFKRPCEVIR